MRDSSSDLAPFSQNFLSSISGVSLGFSPLTAAPVPAGSSTHTHHPHPDASSGPSASTQASRVMDPDKLDHHAWSYHGEGNRSLVASHLQIPRVLRFLKYPAADSENPPQTSEQTYRQIQSIVDFTSNIMCSFIGEEFIHSGEVVKLPLEFVRQLSIKVQHQRPAWRCNKVMDIYSGCALCLPNLTTPLYHTPTLAPPLCIEIKPKCGFLPSSKHVTKEVKSRVCRFCMHQHYKVSNGMWKKRSLYCPLDLFSGNRQRMAFAIRHLIEEPQNNFKIFKGGQMIYSSRDRDREDCEDSTDCVTSLLNQLRIYFTSANQRISGHNKSLLHDFIQVLVKALLSGGGASMGDSSHRRTEWRGFCEGSSFSRERLRHNSQELPSHCVLSRVLHTQMLDSLDIEGLFPLYRRVEQHLHHFPKERSRLQVDGPYDEMFLQSLHKCPAEDDGSVEYAVARVHQYRAAMTAKDCSIMITLMPTAEEEDGHQRTLSVSVSVLDLDPKPFESVPRQMRLDQKVVNSFIRNSTGLKPPPREDCMLLFHPV